MATQCELHVSTSIYVEDEDRYTIYIKKISTNFSSDRKKKECEDEIKVDHIKFSIEISNSA